MDSKRQALVSNLKAGDRVYLGGDHPVRLADVAHLGGGLVILRTDDGVEVRKDSRQVVLLQG